jgi:hypothetical protein
MGLKTVLLIRVRNHWGPWIRIQIQIRNPDQDPGGRKWATNIEKKI